MFVLNVGGIVGPLDKRKLLWLCGGACVVGVGAWGLCNGVSLWRRRRAVSQKMLLMQQERDDSLRELETRLKETYDPQAVAAIAKLSLKTLADKLKRGELKPTEVLRVYQWLALEAHKKTNCLIAPVREAEEWAQALEEDPNRQGALYGVPISLKESVGLNAYRYSHGVTTFEDYCNAGDIGTAEILKAQGAIPFVVTNIPQAYIAFETQNPIYGTTTLPDHPSRSAGGSSGGEAALIACGGSLLGFGSDIGGSLRLPAHFVGICAFKPSWERCSQKGEEMLGQQVVESSLGPLARDVDSLVMAMRAVGVPELFRKHRRVPPVAFRDELYTDRRPLRIGYFFDDGFFPASPACARAVDIAKRHLEMRGHVLVPWTPLGTKGLGRLAWAQSVSADGGLAWKGVLVDDPVDPCIELLYSFFTMNPVLRKLRIWLAKLAGNWKLCDVLENTCELSVSGYWQHIEKVEKYRQDFLKYWRECKLDAAIGPAAVTPATRLNASGLLFQISTYSMLQNSINAPAGVVPVSRVTEQDVEDMKIFSTGDPLDAFMQDTLRGAQGLPLAVQCFTMHWEDELCLRVMKEIEEGLEQA